MAAKRLGEALDGYGVSSFVAHDTIEPMESWQHEIEKGLQTMEVMLAFITADFHDSIWTNQEIGFALGRDVPIVALKLEGHDPRGFIGARQALRGDLSAPERSAPDVYKVLAEKLGQKARLQDALISAFLETPDWGEARIRFERMSQLVTSLSPEEVGRIIQGFAANDQLYGAAYLVNQADRLRKFLERVTGDRFVVGRREIQIVKPKDGSQEEVPF